MPISTAPGTPPRHSSSMNDGETLPILKTARTRWGAPPTPASASTTSPACLIVLLACLLVALAFSNHSNKGASRPALAPPSSQRTLISGNSPSALSNLCKDAKHAAVANSVSLMHNARLCSFHLDWESIEDLKDRVDIIFGVQEGGIDAAFDPEYLIWARDMPLKGADDWIDASCVERDKPPCSIHEILALRGAFYWQHMAKQALDARARGFSIRIVFTPNVALAENHPVAHRLLVEQMLALQEPIAQQLGLPLSRDQWAALRQQPLQEPVDAGTCWVVHGRAAYARCLPTFIIIGAQKTGTDELSVWLNFNNYHKRMDGGAETHFFDCVGRATGRDREPCFRGRTFSEMSRAAGALSANHSSGPLWSWAGFRRQMPLIENKLFEIYARLGRLDRNEYFRQPSRVLVYEKTPSYSDLAHPFDVKRLLPSVKLIFMTRDPVPRLYSSYWQSCESIPKGEPKCSAEEFEQLVRDLVEGRPFVDDKSQRYAEMQRALQHGMYADTLGRWVEAFGKGRNQIFVLDAWHMRFVPQAVVYAIESFVGNHGPQRHHEYKPRWENGFWVLGDYSKATKSTHPTKMSSNITSLLREFYSPHVAKYKDFLERYKHLLVFGCVGDSFPREFKQSHRDFFVGEGGNQLLWPPWIFGK